MTYTKISIVLLVISNITFLSSLACTTKATSELKKELKTVNAKLSIHDEKILALEDNNV